VGRRELGIPLVLGAQHKAELLAALSVYAFPAEVKIPFGRYVGLRTRDPWLNCCIQGDN